MAKTNGRDCRVTLDNKALNRSVHTFAVGQSSDGRELPLYPTPFSQLQYFLTPRLTQALSRLRSSMAYAIFGLFACLIAGWIWAEYNVQNPTTRLSIGGAIILLLCFALFSMQQHAFIRSAHQYAAFRLIGEAINDGDTQAVQDALREYTSQEEHASSYTIVDALPDRK